MIPKIIHYCWFGRGPMPKVVTWCIESWKRKCPDYEIKLWNEDNFDINSVPFVKQAYELKKYAFVADYVRMYALYHDGGICMDSDEYALRSFDDLLDNCVVSCHEYYPGMFAQNLSKLDKETWLPEGEEKWMQYSGLGICANPLLAEPHHPLIKDCLDYYNTHDFMYRDNDFSNDEQIVGAVLTRAAMKYGYRYNAGVQHLDEGILILGPEQFILNSLFYSFTKSRVVHMALGSWTNVDNSKFLRKLMLNHPYIALMHLQFKCLMRKIKHLFMSKQESRLRNGNFWKL